MYGHAICFTGDLPYLPHLVFHFKMLSKVSKRKRCKFTFEIQNEQNVLVQQQQKEQLWVMLQFHYTPTKYILHSEVILQKIMSFFKHNSCINSFSTMYYFIFYRNAVLYYFAINYTIISKVWCFTRRQL